MNRKCSEKGKGGCKNVNKIKAFLNDRLIVSVTYWLTYLINQFTYAVTHSKASHPVNDRARKKNGNMQKMLT